MSQMEPPIDVPEHNPSAIVEELAIEGAGHHGSKASATTVEKTTEEPERRAHPLLLSVLCMCAGLEGIDSMLLRAVFFALQSDLGLSLNDLATVTLFQAVAQALSAPFWGVIADRGLLNRKTILVIGSILQGVVTASLAGVSALPPMIVLRSLNGVMLASLRPITNGIVADVTSESQRGKTYGWICASVNIGMVIGSLAAAPLSTRTVGGMQGWRVAHLGVGAIAVLVGFFVAVFMKNPPRQQVAEGKKEGALAQEAMRLWGYLRMPTFFALVVQGCFGCIPWNALGYQILFFQVGGLGDLEASLLQSFNLCAGACGSILGGMIGDCCARRSRNHGRVFVAQFSVFAGIPIAWLIFMVPSPQKGAFVWYFFLVVMLGLTATWTPTGTMLPILSQVVSEGRSAIMAWQAALEGSCAAIFGNAAVGFLAEKVFGYSLSNADGHGGAMSPENTRALGSALMWTSFVPWIICFGFYSLLHWSYPRDLRRLEQKLRAEMQAMEPCELSREQDVEVRPEGDQGKKGERSPAGPGLPRVVAAATAAAAGPEQLGPTADAQPQRASV